VGWEPLRAACDTRCAVTPCPQPTVASRTERLPTAAERVCNPPVGSNQAAPPWQSHHRGCIKTSACSAVTAGPASVPAVPISASPRAAASTERSQESNVISRVSLRALGDKLWGGRDRPQGTGEKHRASKGRQSRTAIVWHRLPSPPDLSPRAMWLCWPICR